MNEQKIIEIVRYLEQEVPKEGAQVEFASFGEVALYANKDGYLRMALGSKRGHP